MRRGKVLPVYIKQNFDQDLFPILLIISLYNPKSFSQNGIPLYHIYTKE